MLYFMWILDNLPVADYVKFGNYKLKVCILTLFLITPQLYLFKFERAICMYFASIRNSEHIASVFN
jgi:hypothetical protein